MVPPAKPGVTCTTGGALDEVDDTVLEVLRYRWVISNAVILATHR